MPSSIRRDAVPSVRPIAILTHSVLMLNPTIFTTQVASLQSHRDGLRAKLHKREAKDEARRNRKDWSKPLTFSCLDEIAQALCTLVAPTAVFMYVPHRCGCWHPKGKPTHPFAL